MQECFDLVSLSIGMAPCEDTDKLGRLLGLSETKDGFFSEKNEETAYHESSQKGIFMAGAATGLKPIKDCMQDGASVAVKVATYLNKTGDNNGRKHFQSEK
jgi:heterodisulfide reductase subunit A